MKELGSYRDAFAAHLLPLVHLRVSIIICKIKSVQLQMAHSNEVIRIRQAKHLPSPSGQLWAALGDHHRLFCIPSDILLSSWIHQRHHDCHHGVLAFLHRHYPTQVPSKDCSSTKARVSLVNWRFCPELLFMEFTSINYEGGSAPWQTINHHHSQTQRPIVFHW